MRLHAPRRSSVRRALQGRPSRRLLAARSPFILLLAAPRARRASSVPAACLCRIPIELHGLDDDSRIMFMNVRRQVINEWSHDPVDTVDLVEYDDFASRLTSDLAILD